jgi:hypothetical protein
MIRLHLPPAAALAALAALALTACSKSDTAPVPQHNDVAASMPDAASTPGAQGPGAAAPHETPPVQQPALQDPTPQTGGRSATANPADHPS